MGLNLQTLLMFEEGIIGRKHKKIQLTWSLNLENVGLKTFTVEAWTLNTKRCLQSKTANQSE